MLNPNEIDLLDRNKSIRTFKKGKPLFFQGDSCTGVYCVLEGTVAIRKTDVEGNSLLVSMVHPGQTIGHRAYFAGTEFKATAEALSDVTACFVENKVLRNLLDGQPQLGLKFLSHLATDLESAQEAILKQGTLPVRTRLSHLLLTMKDRYGKMNGSGFLEITLPVNRQEMASLLATRPETLARTFHAMAEDQVLKVSGRKVVVPDLDNLLDEVEQKD